LFVVVEIKLAFKLIGDTRNHAYAKKVMCRPRLAIYSSVRVHVTSVQAAVTSAAAATQIVLMTRLVSDFVAAEGMTFSVTSGFSFRGSRRLSA
jgi:hypothetical protein